MITTERLTLCPVNSDNAQHIANLITEKVSSWTAQIPWPYQLSDAFSWINGTIPERRLGIFLSKTQKLIGAISIPATDGDEIGFWINERYENQGYATEAAAGVIDYAFYKNNLTFIDSSVHHENTGSRIVHEKLGFVAIAQEERFWPNKNAMVPVVVYRLYKSQWVKAEKHY